MSTTTPAEPTPAGTAPAAPASDSPTVERARTIVTAVAMALSAATVALMLVITPWGERNELGYDDIAPIRDAAWSGVLVDGFAFALLGITLGLATCRLARSRGAGAALVAAVLTIAGGVLFAMGSFGFGVTAWYATSEGISPDAGHELLAYVEDNPGHFYGVTGAGFLLFTIGTLVVLAALRRARAVPVAGVVVVAALTLAQFSPAPARMLDMIQIALMVCWVALAAVLVRRG